MKRILSIHLNDSTYKIFYPKEIYKNITHQTNEVLGFVEHPSNPNLKTFYTLRLSNILDLAYTGKFYSDEKSTKYKLLY